MAQNSLPRRVTLWIFPIFLFISLSIPLQGDRRIYQFYVYNFQSLFYISLEFDLFKAYPEQLFEDSEDDDEAEEDVYIHDNVVDHTKVNFLLVNYFPSVDNLILVRSTNHKTTELWVFSSPSVCNVCARTFIPPNEAHLWTCLSITQSITFIVVFLHKKRCYCEYLAYFFLMFFRLVYVYLSDYRIVCISLSLFFNYFVPMDLVFLVFLLI